MKLELKHFAAGVYMYGFGDRRFLICQRYGGAWSLEERVGEDNIFLGNFGKKSQAKSRLDQIVSS